MTLAVCIRCGAMKVGALIPCRECQFDPEKNEDKAKSMVLTDHFFSQNELEKISERIRVGEAVTYPQGMVDEFVKTFEENPNFGKLPLSIKIGCISAAVACIFLVVWLIMRTI